MACHWIKIPGKDGQPDTVAHINMGREPRRTCKFCGRDTVAFLCDYVIAYRTDKAITCDRGCCRRCARQIGPDLHHCPNHKDKPAAAPARQESLPL